MSEEKKITIDPVIHEVLHVFARTSSGNVARCAHLLASISICLGLLNTLASEADKETIQRDRAIALAERLSIRLDTLRTEFMELEGLESEAEHD